jgi:hypothetical protein
VKDDAFTEELDPLIAETLLGDSYNSDCVYTIINMPDKCVINKKYKKDGEEEEIILEDSYVPVEAEVANKEYDYTVHIRDKSGSALYTTMIVLSILSCILILLSILFNGHLGYWISSSADWLAGVIYKCLKILKRL